MKSQNAELVKNEIKVLQEIAQVMKAVVESETMDGEEANEILEKEKNSLEGVITNLQKLTA